MIAPSISIGDLQVDMLGIISGKWCSRYLTHPGEQEVNIGSTPPFWMRPSSSVASSMMVRSAPKSVSNTLSKPRRRSACVILPVTRVPMGRPNSSPSATRTAGAGCTTTNFSGSESASQTLSVSSRSRSAPTGQALMHWPQNTQSVSSMVFPNAGAITVLKPRFTAPIAPIFCTLRQTATQRRHRMHLFGSRTMDGEKLSSG